MKYLLKYFPQDAEIYYNLGIVYEKLKKFTDFFVKYRRYFCAAVLFVILVVILVKCTGPQKDQKETQKRYTGE